MSRYQSYVSYLVTAAPHTPGVVVVREVRKRSIIVNLVHQRNA